MGGWQGEGKDTIIWNGTIKASKFIGEIEPTPLIKLNDIQNPDASHTILMGGNTLTWNFTNPIGGMLFNLTGGWSGHVLEILDNAVTSSDIEDHLIHIETSRENVLSGHFVNNHANGRALYTKGQNILSSLGSGAVQANSSGLLSSGTLPIASGGTGKTSFTAGQVLFGELAQSSNLFWNNTSNRLGIGTSSPASSLDVTGTISIAGTGTIRHINSKDNFFDVNIRQGTTTDENAFIRWGRETNTGTGTLTSNWYLGDGTAGVAMNLNHKTGRLGIGTTNPLYRLDVNQGGTTDGLRVKSGSISNDVTSNIYFTLTTSNEIHAQITALRSGGTNGFLAFHTRQSGSVNEVMRLDNTGRVGIGTTSPSTLGLLDVAGNIILSGENREVKTTGGHLEIGTISNNTLRFYSNNTERIRLQTGGFVNILNKTRIGGNLDDIATEMLDVDGNIKLLNNGNGLVVTSPDGSITRTIRIDNSGNVVAV